MSRKQSMRWWVAEDGQEEKSLTLFQKSEAMKNQTWDCDGMEGSNDRIRNITFQLSFDPCISFIQHLWWVTPHLEHEWPWKFVDFVWLLITNIPCYIELLSQCTMQVAYKAGEQSWWKQSILRSWNRKQSMGTRLAEDGPGVQRMENSSQWEESSSGEASIRLSSKLVNSYEVRELFDRTW